MRRALLASVMTLSLPGLAWGDSVEEALRQRVSRLGGDAASAGVARFYSARDFRPAWSNGDQAQALVGLVEALPGHGLDPSDFPLERLRESVPARALEGVVQAERDILLTTTLARLVRQISVGKVDPRRLYPEWNFALLPGAEEVAAQLDGLLQASALAPAVEGLEPPFPEYQGLRKALASYRELAQRGPWPVVPSGPSLKPGMEDPRVVALRTRLAAEGEAVVNGQKSSTFFDPTLAEAVARFQARHGLEPDGAVGAQTLAALNVPVLARVDQIRVNLERLRWVARDRVGDHLMVDVAGFTARLYLEGQKAWDSRVVVGRPVRKTPAFRADLTYLVLNPRWVVPPTILREDVLPKLAADPAYLAAHDMTVVDGAGQAVASEAIDWHHYRNGGFPHQIVQVPGPDNPLGQIKFMLPNPYAIYLHDTPSRRLFQRTDRAQSSGCVRLEKPLDLAVLLLDDPARWSLEGLKTELANNRTRTVSVKRRVPVLVLYFTAEADGAGTIGFRPDFYDRDGAVRAALNRSTRD